MKVLHATPVLVAKTSTGKSKFWQGFAVTDDSGAYTYTEYWQDNSKRQQSALTRIEGKNVGRSNATTPAEQAVRDIQSKERKQRDEGYAEEGVRSDVLPLPMLAHPFDKRSHDMAWPCYGQPKYDGCRALTDGKRFWSRQGKLFLPDVVAHLRFDAQGRVFDGELMLPHDKFTFQEGISATKKYDPIRSKQLEYHIYDVVLEEIAYAERLFIIQQLFEEGRAPNNARQVETVELANIDALKEYQGKNIERGYEGTMLRHPRGTYRIGHRSAQLLKFKEMLDEEFEIVGVKQGQGKAEGMAIFTCKLPNGDTFDVFPRGTEAERMRMYQERNQFISKQLTVRYQNMSDDGRPRFPIGIGVRDYE